MTARERPAEMSEPSVGVPTIKMVAAHAGVSPMTVSRVLAGGGNVSPALAEKVRASVADLGYHRNEQARSLRPGQRSGLVGVSISNIANPYYARFLLGAEETLGATGRTLMIGSTADSGEREARLLSEFIGRQVEGLLVVPSGVRAHLLPERLAGVPIVLASRQVPGIGADAVLVGDVRGAYEATAALIADGHERIAFLGNAMSAFTGSRRHEGFLLAHHDAGLRVDPVLVRRSEHPHGDAVHAAQAELATLLDTLPVEQWPTAVFCANNRNTVGALRVLATRPATAAIMIAAFDDFELADVIARPLLVIDHDAFDLGRRAATLLLARMSGAESGPPQTIELPTRLRLLPEHHSPVLPEPVEGPS